ncbi:hypothetical protein GGTG_02450 [Gaeumannomyces tritici R3-111a-1]|uniref:DUF1445 domain-containing protein n=1 Tax=Gaeumannomyces tritici (strain R3-111a-1) TaxID=644352 RepID=J3NME6_GAET3|nr:hypothetical protein GGTG_02450 [Gaeumannomyces tritici R3-111a-1]EJT82477.1 hypothetical protein GGTG_02450 [Gaeumannomyces tritici R3-111a-1]
MAEQTTSTPVDAYQTGKAVRLAARNKTFTGQTSGLAPSYLQANLLVLPKRYAADFRLLCARNPVPCPLLAESATPGDATALVSHVAAPRNSGVKAAAAAAATTTLPVAADIDLRHDFPAYTVYRDGVLTAQRQTDIAAEWTADHVGFLVGCSYSFEAALAAAGLTPRHVAQGRNVPMYRTTVPLMAAGVFSGATMVVSMRPYRAGAEVERVRDVTRAFASSHGEPVAWGWDGAAALGVADVARPEFGDAPLSGDGSGRAFGPGEGLGDEGGGGGGEFVPVFWGCGVTPQEAVRQAGLQGTVMAHAPGHMVVLDLTDREVFPGLA